MTTPRPRRLAPLVILGIMLVAALTAIGCGSSGGGGSGDANPATITPATAPLYVQATIRPTGDQKTAIEGIVKKLGGVENPGEQIQKALDQSIRKSDSKLSFKDDIEPWLGDHIALVAPTLTGTGNNQDVAVIIATTDSDKAKEAIKKDADGATSAKYNDVEYSVKDDTAEGIVKDFLVIGSVKGFKAVVDASSGDNLADSDAYKSSAAANAKDTLGVLYINTRRFLDDLSTAGQIPAAQVQQFRQAAGAAGSAPVIGTLTAATDQLKLQLDGPAAGAATSPDQSSVLPELPEATWLALGVPKLGANLTRGIAEAGGAAAIVDSLEQQVLAQTGINLKTDVFSVLGDMAFFASGTTLPTLNAGAIFDTSSPADGARLIAKLRPLVTRALKTSSPPGTVTTIPGGFAVSSPNLPAKVEVVQQGDKLAIVYGGAARAVNPTQSLASNPDFRDAATAVGAPVNFFLSFPAIVSIGEATMGTSPSFAKTKETLEKLKWLSFGGKTEGSNQTATFVLQLQ